MSNQIRHFFPYRKYARTGNIDQNGNKIDALEFGDVNFASQLTQKLFDVPAGLEIYEATGKDDVSRLLHANSTFAQRTKNYVGQLRNAVRKSQEINFQSKLIKEKDTVNFYQFKDKNDNLRHVQVFLRENPLKLQNRISSGLIEETVDGMRQQLSPNPNGQMP